MELHGKITGGPIPTGDVWLSGAKNSATRILAATLLSKTKSTLTNFPTRLVDVGHKIRFIEGLGTKVEVNHETNTLTVDPGVLDTSTFTEEDDFPIRTTYLLVAGQILRNGFARVPYPGGCKIGSRGYDLHVMVWRDLGCEVIEAPDAIEVRAKHFVGGEIDFPISTVGGTENALLCAAIAKGQTTISNAYITPEIEDLISFLRRMGAQIEIYGGSLIKVTGVERLDGAHKPIMADRIEALTWIVYALLSKGELRIHNVPFDAMEIPLIHLEEMGIDLFKSSNSIYVHPNCIRSGKIQPFELACGTHPGVISDMQAFYVMLGLVAAGKSRIFDYRYPERIAFVDELAKLCAPNAIEAEPGRITTMGNTTFVPGRVKSTDLRGSMAVVMAALCADGTSYVEDIHMALRGYNDLQGKLAKLGIDIEIMPA